MKRLLSLVLIVTILLSTFSGINIFVSAEELPGSGKCGDNAYYTFDSETGVLTISGSGTMGEYNGIHPFKNQKYIKSVVIDSGITEISSWAFVECKRLKSVNIPATVTKIGYSAFSHCEQLESIEIPNSVTEIGDWAFSSCYKLTSIIIPDLVKEIKNSSFSGCSSLKAVKLGSSVVKIGDSAFSSCNLTGIELPQGLKEIGDYAFSYAGNIETIHIPNSVTEIGERAFYETVRYDAYIPSSVVYIGRSAFYHSTDYAYEERLKIFGETDSEAEYYAKEEKIKFINDINHSHTFNIKSVEEQWNGVIVIYKCSCGRFGDSVDSKVYYTPGWVKLAKPTVKNYYSGSQIKPEVILYSEFSTKIDKKYYTVKYTNNVNTGTAKATIIFKDVYKAFDNYTLYTTFKIYPRKLTKETCSVDSYTYTGKAIVPVPYYYRSVVKTNSDGIKYTQKVKTYFKKGKDYTISVSGGHKNVGTYTATIKFKGNFTGTAKKAFKILPKPVVKSASTPYSATSIKLTWKKVGGVSGYTVYRYNNQKNKWVRYKNTTSNSMIVPRVSAKDTDVYVRIHTYKKVGKKFYYNIGNKTKYDYNYTKPNKPIVKLINTDFGEFQIKFNRYAGHQIQISDNKSFSNKNNNVCKTFNYYNSSTLAYGWGSTNKYFVRAREYYYNNGRLVVGPWSDVKKITTL